MGRELIAAFLQYRLDHEGQVYTAPMDVWFGDDVLQTVMVDTVLGPDPFEGD